MNTHFSKPLLFLAGLALAACSTASPNILAKSAQSDELQRETLVGVSLPPGCPTLTKTFPPGTTSFVVSYEEPTHRIDGTLVSDLAFTTLYMGSPNGPARAIRVRTNNQKGGALVKLRDIPVFDQEIWLCVTATNLAQKESTVGGP